MVDLGWWIGDDEGVDDEAPTDGGYQHEDGVDGEAYVYVLAKAPSPSAASRFAVPSRAGDQTQYPTSTLYGPGVYEVDPSATGRHNLRSAPRHAALTVGTLLGGDVIDVAKVVTVRVPGADAASEREHWAQVLRKSTGPPIWTLLASSAGQLFLRYIRRLGPQGADVISAGQSTIDVSFLDRTIADILGGPNVDDAEVDQLIQKLTTHDLETAADKAAADRMESSVVEATEKTKQIKSEHLANQFQEHALKKAQEKRKQQREAWEAERPQVGAKQMQRLAQLDVSLAAHEAECKDRLRYVREKRFAESLADGALQPAIFAEETQKSNRMLEVVNQEDLEDSAEQTTKSARGAASEAARSLAGVSDTSLAQALGTMEAAAASSYRILAYKN